MSLECLVCSDNFAKLKQLSCRHAFCRSCLREIERFGKIKCPYCRQETQLSAFGVDDLRSQFGGQLQCSDCQQNDVEMKDGVWCRKCTSILCSRCSAESHREHDGLESTDRLGPVKFCVQQLDKFSAIHTRLTMLQKQLVREYMLQLGEALERELDHDLAQRLRRLKAEKQHLRSAFDLEGRPDDTAAGARQNPPTPPSPQSEDGQSTGEETGSSSSTGVLVPHRSAKDELLSSDSGHFVQILYELTKMSESLTPDEELSALPKDGQIFNPLPLDKTVELFLQSGRFSTFANSIHTLSKRKRSQVPAEYWAAGALDDPCDLCAVVDRRLLFVACVRKGLVAFSLDDGAFVNHYPVTIEDDQLASVAYDPENRFLLTTVLRNFQEWYIQVYEISTMRLRDEIPCPSEQGERVANSWYRWLTPVSGSRVIVSTGDRNRSVLWMVNLHSRRWTTLHTRTNSAFRKAAFHQPKSKNYKEGLLYVPDMHNKSVVTFIMNRATCELTGASEIRTEEFNRELPNCVLASGGTLLVGNWNTGNLIVADLAKCKSQILTCVGPKELFNLYYVQDEGKLLVLCKQKELIEVYTLCN